MSNNLFTNGLFIHLLRRQIALLQNILYHGHELVEILFVACTVNYEIVQRFILKINRLAMPNMQPRKSLQMKITNKTFSTENK